MSVRRVTILTCDICGKEVEIHFDKLPKGYFYFPRRLESGNIETGNRCPACPEQPFEKAMGTK